MTWTEKPITQRALDFKSLLNSVLHGSRSWDLLTLNEVLATLEEGFPAKPSFDVVSRILYACRRLGNQQSSLRLHAYMLKLGMEGHPSLGNYLVSLLAEVGSIGIAQQVFNQLSHRTASSWNSLITGYLKCGTARRALALYQEMQQGSTKPSVVNFVALLKACAKLQDLKNGCRLHTHIAELGLLEKDAFLGSVLVDMYAKCGFISRAREVFDELRFRGVVAWTALIGGYVKHGCVKEALNCYEEMLLEDLSPDVVTFTCCLKACSNLRAMEKGQELHAEIARRGFLGRDLLVGSSLIDMYASCGLLANAQEVFDMLPVKDVVSWTAIISGYTNHGCSEQALECFEQMQLQGVSPNCVTFACSLKACSGAGAIQKGKQIHEELAKRGLAETDQLVGNALVDMYAKSGLLSKAREIFENLLVPDIVSWNALISGYVMHGHAKEALKSYEQIQVDGMTPDDITLVCCLKACGSLGAVEEGRNLHAEISRRGFLERDHVGNVLVDMYAKCGFLVRAEDVLDELPYQGAVSWNSLISGYIKHGYYEEALNCLERMQVEGVYPDAVTLVCALKACGSMGVVEKGEQMHAEISNKAGSLERDPTLGNALVDMYAKCGLLSKAQAVFDKLPSRDIIAWTSLISGYGQVGSSENAIYFFNRMSAEGKEPNLITFVSVLNACGRAGLVDMGEAYFEAMIREYSINPTLEHFTCMVDLLSRTGQVKKAVTLIKEMPFHPDLVVWHTVLGVCQQWGNLELGSQAFKHAVPLDAKDPTAYIFLSNIYSDYRTENKSWKMEGLE